MEPLLCTARRLWHAGAPIGYAGAPFDSASTPFWSLCVPFCRPLGSRLAPTIIWDNLIIDLGKNVDGLLLILRTYRDQVDFKPNPIGGTLNYL